MDEQDKRYIELLIEREMKRHELRMLEIEETKKWIKKKYEN